MFKDLPEKHSIDLFMCEFHHNISLERTEYHKEDITKQILAMHKNDLLSKKCTVLIDATIDLEQSSDMQEIFSNPEIKKLIADGELNVVFMRTAQKFDMLGLDNYYGGITVFVDQR